MCNAWNHRPGCSCGWGGGYTGTAYTTKSSNLFYGVPVIKNVYESFVNPNASCPVCGKHVFFYQSLSGGRVFFDDLGPPWPKHGCTSYQSQPKPMEGIKKYNVERCLWKINGWSPFIISLISSNDKFTLRIQGECNGKELNIYIVKYRVMIDDDFVISEKSIVHIKQKNTDEYKLSFISDIGTEFNILAYRYASLISNGEKFRQKQALRTKKRMYGRKST